MKLGVYLITIVGLAVATNTHVAADNKPNILFVLTDDQDILLGSSDYQPKIKKLLVDEGIKINNQFVSTPVCCPSRGSFLTGLHIHNIPMTNNSLPGNCSGEAWNNGAEKKTIGVQMQAFNYKTFFSGKYLNQYGNPHAGGVEHVPPGWNKWVGLVGNSRYYNYTISNDGVAEKHGDNYATDYLTDVVKNHTLSFIRKTVKENPDQPFFAMASVPAAHSPHEPAPQYAYHFKPELKVPRNPNYGIATTDKHWLVTNQGKVWDADRERRSQFSDWEHNRRIEALLSVDDMVEEFVNTLAALNVLDNTYIFYTSDHGYHLGQFGLMKDKRFPYEFDIRTPSYVRGPALKKGYETNLVMLNIDYLPTFIDIASSSSSSNNNNNNNNSNKDDEEVKNQIMLKHYDFDGHSVFDELKNIGMTQNNNNNNNNKDQKEEEEGRDFLIEYFGEVMAHIPGNSPCQDEWSTGMSCWTEGNEPLQPGPFSGGILCSCQDSANNTYACVRRVNGGYSSNTDVEEKKNMLANNFLYCQFNDDDSFEEYYDIDQDQWQLKNAINDLNSNERNELKGMLKRFVKCHGSESCR